MSQGIGDSEKGRKLSDFLCFALYSANNAMQRAIRPAFSQFGLTYSQYLVLVTLWEQDHRLVNEIGKALYLESNTLTPLIKKLEKTNLVERKRDHKDERKVRVSLTAEGMAMKEKTSILSQTILDLSGLSEKDFRSLQKKIVQLREQFKKAGQS